MKDNSNIVEQFDMSAVSGLVLSIISAKNKGQFLHQAGSRTKAESSDAMKGKHGMVSGQLVARMDRHCAGHGNRDSCTDRLFTEGHPLIKVNTYHLHC